MILGYEQPVDIPVMSIYDKEMTKMYINALREDYKDSLEEQKEFREKYSDFYSSSPKDMENWYNLTFGRIDNFLNQNPDANRSVQGRQEMRRIINSTPVGELASLRATAKAGEKYQDSVDQLKKQGLYNEDFERMINNGKTLKDWDTLKDGVWQNSGATAFKDVNQFTAHWFDDLKPRDKGKVGRFGRKMAIDEDELREVVKDNLNQIKDTPLGKYYIDKYGGTLEALENSIVQSNKERLRSEIVVDQVAKAEFDAKMEEQKLALQRQEAARKAAEDAVRASQQQGSHSVNLGMYWQTMEALTGKRNTSFNDAFNAWQLKRAQNHAERGLKAMGIKKGSKRYKSAYKNAVDNFLKTTNESARNRFYREQVRRKTLDDLIQSAHPYHMDQALAGYESDDEGYMTATKDTKIFSRGQMETIAAGKGLKNKKRYTPEDVGRFRPSSRNGMTFLPNRAGNIRRYIEVVDESGTLWYIDQGTYDPNWSKYMTEDQNVLHEVGQSTGKLDTSYTTNR